MEKINTLSILWRNILNIEQELFYKVDQVEDISIVCIAEKFSKKILEPVMLHSRVFFQLGSAASVKHLLLYAMLSPVLRLKLVVVVYRHLDRGDDYLPLEHFLFTENRNIDISYPPLQRSIWPTG